MSAKRPKKQIDPPQAPPAATDAAAPADASPTVAPSAAPDATPAVPAIPEASAAAALPTPSDSATVTTEPVTRVPPAQAAPTAASTPMASSELTPDEATASPAQTTPPEPVTAESGTTASIPDLQYHPLCELFPPMSPANYALFRRDIELGHRTILIVWTYQGMIIDGRHTYRACKELGRVPDVREWDGQGSLLDFVIAQNLHTRHLSSSQRACLALDIEPQLAAEAAARQQQGKADVPQKIGEGQKVDRHAGEAATQAAKIAGTNREYVAQAKRLRTLWPEQFQRVRLGEIELGEATRLLREAMQRLKTRSPMLHQEVLDGKRTLPQAERRAERLRASEAPKQNPPAKVNARDDLSRSDTPEALPAPGTATDSGTESPAIVEVTDSSTAQAPEAEAEPETAQTSAVDASTGTARLSAHDQDWFDRLISLYRDAPLPVRLRLLGTPAVRADLQRLEVAQ